MKKRIYILSLILLICNVAFAQFVGKDGVSKALFYLQKEELDSAKKYIDEAAVDSTINSEAKTWYYKGFIYKELYKTKEKDDKNSKFRLEAITALKKLMDVDKEQEFTESSSKMLNYLASTLYNDAARSLTPETYQLAEGNFDKFKETMILSNLNVELTSQDVKFKLALASMLNQSAQQSGQVDSSKKEQIKSIYKEVIVLDSNNGSAHYNVGILYYNDAADIINNMDYDMDLERLNELQDVCIDLFLKALPYMIKSYELGYNPKETLIGLGNIYHGLNDEEKENKYKKELEELESTDGK
jgi:tetratricopeptide (TPR) repeat protein